MRSRTKGPLETYTMCPSTQWSYNSYPVWDPVGWTPKQRNPLRVRTALESESILDEYPGDRIRKPETACVHTSEKVVMHTTPIRFYQGGNVYESPAAAYAPYAGSSMKLPSPVASYPDLLTEFLAGVDPQRLEMQTIPFVAEFAEAARMLRNPFNILRAHRLFEWNGPRRTPLGKVLARKGLDRSSSAWLEWHYGWVPFFGDLCDGTTALLGASDAYERYLKGDTQWLTGNISRVVQSVDGVTTDSIGLTQEDIKLSERYRVTFKYRCKPASGNVLSYPSFLARKVGITPSQLIPAAWELIPYSFIADWFLPVGDLLQRVAQVRSDFKIQKVSRHSTIQGTHVHRVKPPAKSGGGSKGWPGVTDSLVSAWTCERTTYVRNYHMSPVEGSIGVDGITTTRALSALSLIAQRLVHSLT